MVEISDNPDDDVRKTSSEALRNESEASENARREEGRENDIEESQFDPNKMRKTKPGVKRLLLSLSVLLSFLFGLPFLLKSVEIYRSPLPFQDIDLLSREIESEPILFPCRFQAVFINSDAKTHSSDHAQKLGFSISDHMRELVGDHIRVCGTCGSNFTVSVTMQSKASCITNQNFDTACFWQCGSVKDSDFDVDLKNDELVDEFLASVLVGGEKCSYSTGKVYSVVVLNTDGEIKAVVGKHRHGWILGKISEANAVKTIAEVFVKVFINGGKEEGSIHGEFMPVGADGRVVLSFNLLNADPRDWIYDWDFHSVDETLLAPVIEALEPIADISVESQILYHTPKSFFSYWDDKRGSYIFNTKDLPFFVNSNEWHLDTSVAAGGRSKILHIVIYIPSAKECPLLLQLPNGEISMTNGFISPMWGGVIVWNSSNCPRTSGSKHPIRHTIPFEDLKKVIEVFLGQLRQLFGLQSNGVYVGASDRVNLLASERGFTEWELDVLSRQHTCFNLLSCVTTLGSLSRLIQSLPRMIIMDEIGKQVKFSLQAANFAQNNASVGIYQSSAVSSRQSRALAEDAFYHSSIMSISYYSFEHWFAVYSPFFLPVSLHVILAAIKEWRRYKRERSKYMAWKAIEKVKS
ncbi:hypothetical protein Nepgr_032783 [Nepenthes gracilis]|uniref:GPI transamidase component PIG-S n=1 Tax=Nepenthes gracilis TaxID=150966 RepID=A0AAD3TK04_NEPGR|nr:hypothetical protein Nepgr_032783 [Nepenthes gracilis]